MYGQTIYRPGPDQADRVPGERLSPDKTIDDILCICRERLGIIKDAYIQSAPDLVVEILSPATVELDRVTKRRLYGRYGAREFWIADPEGRSIEVTSHNGRELATVQVYPLGRHWQAPC